MNFRKDFAKISHMAFTRSFIHVLSEDCATCYDLPPFHTNHVIRYKESCDQMQGLM